MQLLTFYRQLGMAPINNWGKMDLQSTGNNDLANGSSNLQQVGGYGSNLVGQTLEGILKHQNEYGNISGGVGGASGTLPFATDSVSENPISLNELA